jgi:hypothetical protein
MKKFYFFIVIIGFVIALVSCNDNGTNTPVDHFDLTGSWLVTRTLVTPSTDFPNGYQDQQTWTFTKNGDVCTLTTSAGSVTGEWKSSSVYSQPHWVFDISWYDPTYGIYSRVVVEIINNNPLKGTDDTYYKDPSTGIWLLLDSFSIAGIKQ